MSVDLKCSELPSTKPDEGLPLSLLVGLVSWANLPEAQRRERLRAALRTIAPEHTSATAFEKTAEVINVLRAPRPDLWDDAIRGVAQSIVAHLQSLTDDMVQGYHALDLAYRYWRTKSEDERLAKSSERWFREQEEFIEARARELSLGSSVRIGCGSPGKIGGRNASGAL